MKTAILFLFLCSAAQAQMSLGNSFFTAGVLKPVAAAESGGFPQPGSITHHWSMEEASGTRVDAVGSLDMTPAGIISQATGINGHCIDITAAASAVTNLAAAGFDINYPFTFAMWVKSADTTPVVAQGLFFTDYGSDMSTVLDTDGTVYIIVGDEGDAYPTVALGANNTWHLIVCSADDASETRMSIDGSTWAVGNSFASDLSAIGDNFGIFIGSYYDHPPFRSFIGQIDEVTVWATSLSQGEVTTLWNGGAGTFYTP